MTMLRALLVLIACIAVLPAWAAETLVREEKKIAIQGVEETWQLVWEARPKPVCSTDDIETATACPCSGFAYGETGHLTLVRKRPGLETERLDLRSLFADTGIVTGPPMAVLSRWPVNPNDSARAGRDDRKLPGEIERRPATTAMRFGAYDRSARGTQFLIQVDAGPCGHTMYSAVGVTARNPHLHAIGSAANPNKPLVLPIKAWQALLAGPGTHTVVAWPCGDHGSESRTELTLAVVDEQITVKQRIYACTKNDQRGALTSESNE